MCTVTFIPVNDEIFLTSNRDESPGRPQAKPPTVYKNIAGSTLIYPKDKHAAGTWIAAKENGDAAVLLNGAFIKHTRQSSYRKSRGLIFLEIFDAVVPPDHFEDMDLEDIEPFTLIVYFNKLLYECRWDGVNRFIKQLPVSEPRIWSSATLYDDEISKERCRWFNEWQKNTPIITREHILDFHRNAGAGDPHNDLVINRDNKTATLSVTSIHLSPRIAAMVYHDLQNRQQYQAMIPINITQGYQ